MKLITLNGEKGYKKLNHLPFNRDFTLRPSLVKSMQEFGFIVPIICCYTSIISGVRELYILDGQHRALAAQYLNMKFYCIILDEEPNTIERLIKIVSKLNNTSVAWKIETYCKAYASVGYSAYIELLKISKLYGFTVPIVGSMLEGNIGRRLNTDSLKNGSFKITARDITLESINLVRKTELKFTNRMLAGFHKARLTVDNFNFEKFNSKLQKTYKELRASKIDDYYEVFLNYMKN